MGSPSWRPDPLRASCVGLPEAFVVVAMWFLDAQLLPQLGCLNGMPMEDREVSLDGRLAELREVLVLDVFHPHLVSQAVFREHIPFERANKSSRHNSGVRFRDAKGFPGRDDA